MRKVILSLVAAVAVSSPALANETRVEGRGGIYWAGGSSEGTAGIAAGYDFDLGGNTFAGVEVSGDKILTSGTKVSFGAGLRAGMKLEGGAKLYAAGGYSSEPCDLCTDALSLGAGVDVPLGSSLYGKVEYRHFFVDSGFSDANAVVAGLGLRF